MPGSARSLVPAEGELHGLRGQNLRAHTKALGPLDNLHVVQKNCRRRNVLHRQIGRYLIGRFSGRGSGGGEQSESRVGSTGVGGLWSLGHGGIGGCVYMCLWLTYN